ncbi:MAG: hypothetical protein WCJ30_04390 [Deltaproteobacteria bacterium]
MLSRPRALLVGTALSAVLFAPSVLAQQTHAAADYYRLPANAADAVGVLPTTAVADDVNARASDALPAPTSRAVTHPTSRGAQSASTDAVRARERFESGVRFADSLQWSEAAEAFEESYRLLPRPGTLRNLGLAHRALGRYMRALEELQQFLAESSPTPDVRTQVGSIIGDMRAQLATLTIVPSVSGAQLTLDNQPVRANEEIQTDPGNHVIAATSAGYARAAQTLTLRRSESRRYELRLERAGGGFPLAPVLGGTIGGVVVVGLVVLSVVLLSHEAAPDCGTLHVCVSPQ